MIAEGIPLEDPPKKTITPLGFPASDYKEKHLEVVHKKGQEVIQWLYTI